MTKYVNEAALKAVFPNADYYEEDGKLTVRQFQAVQEAIAEHKLRKDGVLEVGLFVDQEEKDREVHVSGGVGDGYKLIVCYVHRQWQSWIHWRADTPSSH